MASGILQGLGNDSGIVMTIVFIRLVSCLGTERSASQQVGDQQGIVVRTTD